MDIFDRASELEEQHRALALSTLAQHHPSGHRYSHCADCGEAIPAARQAAVPGCRRCVSCQQQYE